MKKKNKNKLIGNILLIAGLLLITAAGGLYLYNAHQDDMHAEAAGSIMDRVREEVVSRKDKPTDPSGPSADAPLEDEDKLTLTPVEIDGYVYDGYLTIPAIDLEMAVFDTWNNDYLRNSLCRYYGSPYTSDFVIAGHNFRKSFGKLKKLSPGDEVYFTDMQGNVTAYKVSITEVIGGTDVEGMLSGDWPLSLYTCTFGGQSRLTVRCDYA